MIKNPLKIASLFYLLIAHTSLSQSKYEPGYYVDYSDSIHYGLIDRFFANGQNKIRFKENEKADRIKLGIEEVKQFVVGEDTFEVRNVRLWERNNPLSLSKNDSVADFVRILERGKIELFTHYHIDYGFNYVGGGGTFNSTMVPTRSNVIDYVVRKDSVFTVVKGVGEGAKLPRGFYGIRKLIADDSVVLKRFDDKGYKRRDLRALVATYNARAANRSIGGQVMVFRNSAKRLPKEIGVEYKGITVGKLKKATLIELNVDDINNFSLCLEGFDCVEFSGSAGEINYLELIQGKKEDKPTLVFVEEEVGKYYHQRISFLMEKEKKN